jgi:hypothetical protein
MLVLLSFALVLVATALLVLGLLTSGGLALIYLSIGLSVASAILLIVAVRMARPPEPEATPPEPLDPDRQPQPAAVATATAAPDAPTQGTTTPDATAASGATEESAAPATTAEQQEAGAAREFPIPDYDDLHESVVLPRLSGLDRKQLDAVEARERSAKARPAVLAAIDQHRRTAPPAAAPAVDRPGGPNDSVDREVDDDAPARSKGSGERNPAP